FLVLVGPLNYAKYLTSKERLPSTLIYFSRLGLTLYFSISVSLQSFITSRLHFNNFYYVHSYFGSLSAGAIQVVPLVVHALAY
ncbi:uncharacterized protein BJ212DRAFT_1221433, partial [Suillus subaureus]